MLARREKRRSLRNKVRFFGCLTAFWIVVAVLALIILLALVARDPTGAAGGIAHWWGQVGDTARAIVGAPLGFFRALLTFVENLFH